MYEEKKRQLLKEIEQVLEKYKSKMKIDMYVLDHLDEEELRHIKEGLLKRQENVIQNNKEWLEQFKKY